MHADAYLYSSAPGNYKSIVKDGPRLVTGRNTLDDPWISLPDHIEQSRTSVGEYPAEESARHYTRREREGDDGSGSGR